MDEVVDESGVLKHWCLKLANLFPMFCRSDLERELAEANATGLLPDKHFSRLLAEYDEEQATLEASVTEWQEQLDNWNADRVRMAEFIDLAKRYTDFSELTTPMLNEFIEKIIVHEGSGRGKQRRQRLDF